MFDSKHPSFLVLCAIAQLTLALVLGRLVPFAWRMRVLRIATVRSLRWKHGWLSIRLRRSRNVADIC